MLVVLIFCASLVWWLNFYWTRRKLYRLASKIPGPKSYPLVGCAWIFFGDSEVIFAKVLETLQNYPNISKLWMGPRLFVLVSKPSYLEIILNSPSCLEKDDVYKQIRPLAGTGLFTAPVHKWRKNRRLINPAFNQKILDTFVEIFAEQSKIFIRNLERKSGEKDIDIFSLVGALSVDSLCGKRDALYTGDTAAMEIIFIRQSKIWYQSDFIFNLTKLSKIMDETLSKIHKFTRKVVKEKREVFEKRQQQLINGEEIEEEEEFGKRKTFLELLLQLSSEGKKMTDDELRQEVDTFTIAGSDTTATTLCFCFEMLGMHQDIQQKLFHEVIAVLGEDRDITANDLPLLSHLDRFIKETLRVFPVGPIFYRACDSDVNLGDFVLPEGCSIGLGVIGLHRNENYWKEPLKFNPDRFLPEEIAKRHTYCYLPFSGGPRSCIGAKYAIMSMKSTLAMVIRKLIIKTEYKSIEEIKLKANIVMRPVNGFKISVQSRE